MGIRILACDRQTLVLAGVRAYLSGEPDIQIVSETGDAAEAIRHARKVLPDIVLLGVSDDDGDLAGVVHKLTALGPDASPRVLLMAAPEHESRLLDLLRAGARGVVGKDSTASELGRAVRVVAAGQACLTPSMTRRLLDWAMTAGPLTAQVPQEVARLTGREREVLSMLARGLNDGEIASALRLSKATVRSHIHHMSAKIGVTSRAQAVAFAYRHGLIAALPGR
ncbi:DNA-binding response regulator [Acrocarpospora pleiomorpha]|uniref:DNA-binding response regulator n=1 Tax=Acrocarpospora pleiomorpha TaxID=90975 RepID=A0A5M3XQ39_9ACTN|nr:response regulator transcription factor [Acrocarpospora pleiomorpha]GES20398.1 DNA-binding response regulator [Acrocarpospora pleiomorpha]